MKKTAKLLSLIFLLAAVFCICVFSASAETGLPDFSPENLTAESGDASITLSWDDDDMQGYRVFMEENGKWKTLTTTEETSYTVTGLERLTAYKFAVRGYWLDGTTMRWSSSYPVISAKPLSDLPDFSPENLVAEVGFTSVTLTWADDHYRGYRVFIQENGRWKGLITTGETSYTVTGLKEGTTYKFAVRGYWINGITVWCSNYPQMKVTTLGAPARPAKVNVLTNNSTAFLSWDACVNATGYRIFRYVDGKWVAEKTTSATSYIAKGLDANTTYKFAVRPYFNYGGKIYWATSYTAVTAKTEAKDALNVKTGVIRQNYIQLKWNESASASGYAVFQKVNGKWQQITDTIFELYQVDNLYPSTKYQFCVRSYIEFNGVKYWNSTYSAITASTDDMERVAAPYISNAEGDSVKLNWYVCDGATGSRVFMRVPGGSWSVVGDYPADCYSTVISGLDANTTYQFANRPFAKTPNGTVWAPLSSGVNYTTGDYTKAEILSAVAEDETIALRWSAVPGATGYRIYNKTSSGWVALKTVIGTSYTLTGLESDTVYNLAIRAYKKVNGATNWYAVGPVTTVITEPNASDLIAYRYEAYRDVLDDGEYVLIAENEYNMDYEVYESLIAISETEGDYVVYEYSYDYETESRYVKLGDTLYFVNDTEEYYGETAEPYLDYTYLDIYKNDYCGFYYHDYDVTASLAELDGRTVIVESFVDTDLGYTFKYYFAAGVLLRIECEWEADDGEDRYDYYDVAAVLIPADDEFSEIISILYKIPSSYEEVYFG